MRTKQAFLNTSMSFLLQLILAVTGIFLPRYFIDAYGSPVNGLVTSINQFITYMSLVEAGIGVAGMVALYKPLADKDNREVSAILSAAKRFYLLSGLIFTALCVLLVAFYPLAVKKDIADVSFVRTMIVVLCANTIIDYFYLGKYRVLLQADQRSYVISICHIVGTVVMTAVTLLLIKLGFSAIVVKLAAAVIYLLRSLAVGVYVRCNYPEIDFNAEPRNEAFDQRWSALVHQIVSIVVFNTDVVLLTLMVSENALSEVSVYGTYNLVAYGILGLLSAISSALTPSFGNVMARNEKKALYDSYSSYEFVFFILTFVAHTCMLVLFYPFITLYTEKLPDKALYLRWSLQEMLRGIDNAVNRAVKERGTCPDKHAHYPIRAYKRHRDKEIDRALGNGTPLSLPVMAGTVYHGLCRQSERMQTAVKRKKIYDPPADKHMAAMVPCRVRICHGRPDTCSRVQRNFRARRDR